MIWEVMVSIGHFYGMLIKSLAKILPNLFDDFCMKMQIMYLIQIPLNCLVNVEFMGRTRTLFIREPMCEFPERSNAT